MKKIYLMCVFIMLIIGTVNACDYYCSTCGECETDITNAGSGETICLDTDITSIGGSCINNPDDFNNKIFDCEGHIIEGDNLGEDYGFLINDSDNNVIQNCSVFKFANGIYIRVDSDNNVLYNNNISVNNESGISCWMSDYLNITNNYIAFNGINIGNKSGINFNDCDNADIYNNTIIDNSFYGVYFIEGSDNNFLYNNYLCLNNLSDIEDYSTNSGDENTCNKTYNWDDANTSGCKYSCGEFCYCNSCYDCEIKLTSYPCKKVMLLNDILKTDGICISGASAFLFKDKIFDCQNYTITGNRVDYSNVGLFLYENNYGNIIMNCDIFNFTNAIKSFKSSNNIISNSLFRENEISILVSHSSDLTFFNIDVIKSFNDGIVISYSENINLLNSNIYNGSDNAISIFSSSGIKITASNIIYNVGGVYFIDSVKDSTIINSVICRNIEKDESKYDIYNRYGENVDGKLNYCDYTYKFNDYNREKGCYFLCNGSFIIPEENISVIDNITGVINANVSTTLEKKINQTSQQTFYFNIIVIVEEFGFKTDVSKIFFGFIILLILIIILSLLHFHWIVIIMLSIFILLCFTLIGLIPFWFSLIFLVISALIFAVLFKNMST